MYIEIKQQINIYAQSNGKAPFLEWLESLDNQVRYRVKERLLRVALGNFGDYKVIESGVYELRLTFGAGYRIYFGLVGNEFVILLSGGDKSSQKKDIKKAITYWHDYLKRNLT